MTTAELIQKREEEQKKPLQEQKPDLTGMAAKPNPADVTMQKIDNEANNKAMAQEAIAKNGNVPMPGEKVSLYDAGMNNPDTNNMKDARTSPITSPEYEKFRNEVIGAQQFGVETEEQRKKRERAEAIKQGLVGFTEGLSALANLYYTTKGAPSQKLTSQMPDLQKRLYEERLERDKKLEKFRDYIRGKADKKEERDYNLNLYKLKQEDERKKVAQKTKYDGQAAKIKYLYELGLIDAKKAAEMEKQIGKAKLDKEIESFRQANRVALKTAPSYDDKKVVDSAIGSDGNIYTRNSKLTDNEAMQIAQSSVPDDEMQAFVTKELSGYDPVSAQPVYTTKTDWRAAAAYALQKGYVSPEKLEQMGFKQGRSKSLPGVKAGNKGKKHMNL